MAVRHDSFYLHYIIMIFIAKAEINQGHSGAQTASLPLFFNLEHKLYKCHQNPGVNNQPQVKPVQTTAHKTFADEKKGKEACTLNSLTDYQP